MLGIGRLVMWIVTCNLWVVLVALYDLLLELYCSVGDPCSPKMLHTV